MISVMIPSKIVMMKRGAGEELDDEDGKKRLGEGDPLINVWSVNTHVLKLFEGNTSSSHA